MGALLKARDERKLGGQGEQQGADSPVQFLACTKTKTNIEGPMFLFSR